MKGLYIILMFAVASCTLCARITPNAYSTSTFDVLTYGAIGDGKTDDSNAFLKAWDDACGTEGTPTLIIPDGKTFMLQPLLFPGPCKPATITIEFKGTIIAPRAVEDWRFRQNKNNTWIKFSRINGFVIIGGGKVDGQGSAWWTKYPKKSDENKRPTAIRFYNCHNLTLNNLTHIDSPRNHISIDDCKYTSISNLHIAAPKDSPNTDGIDIALSTNVLINNSTIETGDDCIAINNGSSYINISSIFCGPGHGISVGSLGKDKMYATVEHVYVKNCTFNETSNGARIKTFEGGYGYARNITYEDIIVVRVKHPVIIDQYYDPKTDIIEQAVNVSDVTFLNIRGTSLGKNAVELNCDNIIGCTNIVLNNINIIRVDGGEAQSVLVIDVRFGRKEDHGSISATAIGMRLEPLDVRTNLLIRLDGPVDLILGTS
ncbi:hypothetical protein TSUD_267740 [Trifolium subterraneum]|uniref:Pectate lyase superfamily protein domain-containing protein n=1 Tax=Trifolium subterraneum TaxID=3900 RepID=A0A2Z6PNI2_TRISU|nr:hypothetical protein TSUD_267740 [Trifolium subterraneum]